jgi:aryl-alcohol dehydrogenase-like predicted oxidoreductase
MHIAVLACRPFFLVNGLLTGKYRRGRAPPRTARLAEHASEQTDEVSDKLEALERFGGHGGGRFGRRR